MKRARKEGQRGQEGTEGTEVRGRRGERSKSCYEKYKCQYKQKSILTKLNTDSGYPQDILQGREAGPAASNHVENNKQNLKNFFKDRIPPENALVHSLMRREQEMIHPKRIFEIKQLQYELKNRTKMNLKHSFESHVGQSASSAIDKLNSNFHVKNKTRELKQHYSGARDVSRCYESENFRRGTQSHIEKRSKLLKKQAYDRVFGPDISSLSRTTGFDKGYSPVEVTPPRAKSISLASPFDETRTHKDLRHLILKMHDYKNRLEETSEVLKAGQSEMAGTEGEENMVRLIQNMTSLYQERTINQGVQKIESLEDVAKLSKEFYKQMLIHKDHRLSKRREMAMQTIPSSSPSSDKATVFHSYNTQRLHDDRSELSDEVMEEGEAQEEAKVGGNRPGTVHNRFKLLNKTLVKWAALFYIYGIQRDKIFLAFRGHRQPYELEGSYAFFKCIKLGDAPAIRLFLQNNPDFVFEIEFNGRTPLSYAAFHNQADIARLFLEVGVNSDLACSRGLTSLYYAILRRNVGLVRDLLQKGACPWSIEKNPYGSMVEEGENAEQLRVLLGNARKVYLAMQIQSTINKRKEYWQLNCLRIVEDKPIKYARAL